jgi:hypothetical protein
MKSAKLEKYLALDYILGGRAICTFLNTQTGNRFTFKIKKHKTDDVLFVSVLTSPDHYQFIGSINSNTFRHSKKSRISSSSQSVRVFDFVFNHLKSGNLSELIEIWHHGSCGKCGRILTVPKSIETGFGPECSKNLKK